jgi:MiaB/RimO family radical SAM methylthiotransferase
MQYKVFWCKVNKYYTDKWLNSEALRDQNGLFIASCVVTDSAKKKWVKFVKKELPKLREWEKVWISGCGAFERGAENRQFFDIYPELQHGRDKIEILPEDPDKWGKKEVLQKSSFWNLAKLREWLKALTTRKYVLIQWGCDSFCTFCLTVQKRGRHFFREREDILEEILQFERAWGKEIILTWVNLSAWGLDTTNDITKSRFAELLKYLLEKSDIPRIRISSLWPEFIDQKVLKVFENTRIYPHFHFSIQSGSTNVLKAMRRHYDGEYMRTLLGKVRNIKRKDAVKISIGADLIVGFPGETESNFMDTYNLVGDFQITKLHAFPFSPHKYGEGVPAWFYKEQVDESVKKKRLDRLIQLWKRVRKEFIESQIGQVFEVLLEGKTLGDKFSGWTQNYIEVDETNFEVLEWKIEKNSLVKWVLKWIITEKWDEGFGM